MTEEEKEFADLLKNFDDASVQHGVLKDQIGSEPVYSPPGGLYTMKTLSVYKKDVEEHNRKKTLLVEAEKLLKDATTEISDYLPKGIIDKLQQGVAIFTTVPQGIGVLSWFKGTYITLYGSTQDEVRRKLESFSAQYRR